MLEGWCGFLIPCNSLAPPFLVSGYAAAVSAQYWDVNKESVDTGRSLTDPNLLVLSWMLFTSFGF